MTYVTMKCLVLTWKNRNELVSLNHTRQEQESTHQPEAHVQLIG